MYRRLLVLIALILFDVPVISGETIKAGVMGGLNVTDLASEPEEAPTTARARASFGGFVRTVISGPAAIEARLFWLQTGVDLGPSADDGFSSGRIGIDYLAIPLLFRYGAEEGGIRPYFVSGIELGFKTGTSAILDIQGMSVELDDFDDDVRSNNVSLDVGGGIEVPVSRVFLIVEGLYSHGLRDINAVSGDAEVVKTRALRLNVGIRF